MDGPPVSDASPGGGLNPAQAGRVLATFRVVDDLLLSLGAAVRGSGSPFDRTRLDLAPDEIRQLESFVESLRGEMLDALARLVIPHPTPSISARWSVETALGFAEIAMNELDGASLRAYGAVDPTAAREVDTISAELRASIARGLALVRQAHHSRRREDGLDERR